MRKLLLGLALITGALTCLQTQLRAQQPNTALQVDKQSEAAVSELLELTGAKKNMQAMIDAMVANYKREIPEFSSDYLESLRTAFNYDSLLVQIIPVYTRHLTLTDIKGLIAFYKTPLGQKMIRETPGILKECMELGAKWGAGAGQRALEQYKEKQADSVEEEQPPVVQEQ